MPSVVGWWAGRWPITCAPSWCSKHSTWRSGNAVLTASSTTPIRARSTPRSPLASGAVNSACVPRPGQLSDCYDNALAESFFATLETELLWRERFKSQAEARMAVFEFIEGFYNPRRRHSALDNVSPIVYERRYSETRSSAVETAVSMQIASRSAQPLGSRSAAPTGSHRTTATTSNPSVQLSTETG